MTDRYQIPRHDESPSKEMIEWLHQNTGDWIVGDESGIVITHTEGGEEYGAPGDWIVRDEHGRYHIEKKRSFKEAMADAGLVDSRNVGKIVQESQHMILWRVLGDPRNEMRIGFVDHQWILAVGEGDSYEVLCRHEDWNQFLQLVSEYI